MIEHSGGAHGYEWETVHISIAWRCSVSFFSTFITGSIISISKEAAFATFFDRLPRVDHGQIAVGLRHIGKFADLQSRENLRLCHVQFVVAEIGHLGIVHVEHQPVVDHAEGQRISSLADGQPILAETHIGVNVNSGE